jgi:small subunit ribosomal protein S13
MSSIAGVNLPNKLVPFALRYIHGIGPYRSMHICKSLNIDTNRRVADLTEQELASIRSFIDANYKVETDLKLEVSGNIKAMIAMRNYKGIRHQSNLPVRGQRTRDNARSCKRRKF